METSRAQQAARALFRAAEQYRILAPWRRFSDSEAFQVLLPGHRHPMVVSIHGGGGEHVGMGVFRGPQAAAIFGQIEDQAGVGYESVALAADLVSLDFCTYREVPEQFHTFYAAAGERPRFSSVVPLLWALRGLTSRSTSCTSSPSRRGMDHCGRASGLPPPTCPLLPDHRPGSCPNPPVAPEPASLLGSPAAAGASGPPRAGASAVALEEGALGRSAAAGPARR